MTKKQIWLTVAVALVVILGVAYFATKSEKSEGLLGAVRPIADEFTQGLKLGYGQNTLINSFRLTIGAGSNEAAWKNTTGETVYVYLADAVTTGTASSSYYLYIATSSSATVSNDFSAPFSSIIDTFAIATSSVATTTSSIDKHKVSNNGVIPVAHNEYVLMTLQANTTACANAGAALGLCETATSTNRGITSIVARVFYHN